MKPRRKIALALSASVALAGCTPERGDETKAAPPVRPVLTFVVEPEAEQANGFAGTVQPQYQTDRGFQVLGRIVTRDVDAGDVVKKGQTLATLDPLPYDLAVRSSEADLAKAKSDFSNAAAAEERRSALLQKKVVSQAEYDSAKQANDAAAASEKQASANLDKAREQRSYTKLTSDIDGVVTEVNAEAGQTVSAGQKVMTVARTDIREAVVDIPDDIARALSVGTQFEIRLQANTALKVLGKVREIGPQADATTRTRRVKITLASNPEAFRLGVTISAVPIVPIKEDGFKIPVSALLEEGGTTKVWVVDPAGKTVKSTAVQVASRDKKSARVTGGLMKGDRILIAGVHSVAEGQAVKIGEGVLP